MDGVKRVDTDLKNHEVIVTFDETVTSVDAIVNTLQDNQFVVQSTPRMLR
jgi:copper chaperone CopZ